MFRALIGMCALLGALVACADPIAADEIAVAHAGELEIIGVSGRRLADGDRYRVPLDSDRAIALGVSAREAMVILNRGAGPVRIERFALAAEVGSGARWRLLAPTRARDLVLEAVGATLPPGGRLDFDVGVWPERVGRQRAQLVIAWRQGARHQRVEVALEARAIGASASTGADPP